MPVETVSLKGARILIVEDGTASRNLLCQTLESEGYAVSAVPNGEVALDIVPEEMPELILLDVMLGSLNGFEICRRLKAMPTTQSIPTIFITAKTDADSMLEGFQSGGVDYVTKPFQVEEVLARVEAHLRNHRLTQTLRQREQELAIANARCEKEVTLRQEAEQARQAAHEQLSVYASREHERWGIEGFIGRSRTLRRILHDVQNLQKLGQVSVLITGESGTGKELIARAIHFGGVRASGPFIPVNCSAIPSELAESTLFGHVRGAFTGATGNRKGCFELAHAGTLFLDEISEMALPFQAKLLRVLEDGVITPVGSGLSRTVDARIVAASNADFESAIATGGFRDDLFYRLARFTVEVPPLRHRPDDIPLLADHFLGMFAAEMNLAKPSLHRSALEGLKGYEFPGNVRELKNIMERALIESGGAEIELPHLRLVDPGHEKSRLLGMPAPETPTDEERILAYVREHGTINNVRCRQLLGAGMHRAWYLLNKMHTGGKLTQEKGKRWAQYRLRIE